MLPERIVQRKKFSEAVTVPVMWHREKSLQGGSDRGQQERWAGSLSFHLEGHGPTKGLGLNIGWFDEPNTQFLKQEWESSVA